ncbi:MAG: D-glycero-beta-D-manno-heptose 1-phosphate adenylyltransferase [Planctomycetota bacterium]|nr:D-glycero-beta-D-manno-heptose 1-phosphate adenylyltransferase [Planctomycetota bacterium]
MPNGLIDFVANLPRTNIVLVGDVMLDRYIFGNADRLSPEAPVPVLHFQHEEYRLGGAGSVLADLAALRAFVKIIGIVGNDTAADEIRNRIVAAGSDPAGLVQVADRPTVSKMRLVGSAQHRHPQQMIRLDIENPAPIDSPTASRILDHVAAALTHADVLCIEDYHKGLLTIEITRHIIELSRAKYIPVLVDTANLSDYSKYLGATAIKLNRSEAERATGLPLRSPDHYAPAAEWLLNKLQLQAAIITLDKHGAFLATSDGLRRHLQTRPRQVYDVTGAGDMVLAMLAVARAAGASWIDSVALANIAGGLEVERFGCAPITPDEIIHDLLAQGREHLGKQRALDQLLPELQRHRALGRRIVFTNGCFDIVHFGHVEYFRFAKKQGDILVVAVNTDRSIQKLKGPKRPIVPQHDRISLLEELQSIDYVILFDDDTPIPLLNAIRPDILVKGDDYKKEQVVGWQIVESYGGRIALAPLIDGRSTTALIQRILDAYK